MRSLRIWIVLSWIAAPLDGITVDASRWCGGRRARRVDLLCHRVDPCRSPNLGRGLGRTPALNGLGSFLIKDVALLGISLVVFGECAGRLQESAANAADARVDAFKRSTHDDHS